MAGSAILGKQEQSGLRARRTSHDVDHGSRRASLSAPSSSARAINQALPSSSTSDLAHSLSGRIEATIPSPHADPIPSSSRADAGRRMAGSKLHADADVPSYNEEDLAPGRAMDNVGQGASTSLRAPGANMGYVGAEPVAGADMASGNFTIPSSKLKRPTISATLPGTNDRGYSLRRNLLLRNVGHKTANEQDHEDIELAEAGSSRSSYATEPPGTSPGRPEKKAGVTVTISPIDERESSFPSSMVKKRTRSRALPKNNVWARQQSRGWFKKVNATFDKAVKKVLRIREIQPSKDGRHLDLDAYRKEILIDERTNRPYISNVIRSSRYTLYNFLPRQLIFQFGKLANFYFLIISILQMIPGLSTTGTYTTIVPLLVFVSISMAKEGYDDVRRYKLDKVENNSLVSVLKPRQQNQLTDEESQSPIPISSPEYWVEKKWQEVRVGDIVRLERDEAGPADMVLLHADGPNGIAYIETMALDGETSLKAKQASPLLVKRCKTLVGLTSCNAHVVIEDPNIDLYNFDGRVTVDGETLPLTSNEIVYRGSIVRNTTEVIGMVMNTGEECKIRMNANKDPRTKSPSLQRTVNKVVIIVVVFVLILAGTCTMAYQIWANSFETRAWYIRHARVAFGPILTSFIIMFNTMIPLSLYVSLEIIKLGQLMLMHDVEMYDPITNTPMEARTTTINEELGQVSYIFSDKTGTLTDNVMRFRKMSVAGAAWLHDFDLQREADNPATWAREMRAKQRSKGSPHQKGKHQDNGRFSADYSMSLDTERRGSLARRPSTASHWRSSARPAKAQPEPRTEELLEYLDHKPHGAYSRRAKFFLLSIALCHTCLPETQTDGSIDFQAASPDELALVRAAQELGYMVIDRASQTITLKTRPKGSHFPEANEVYEVLDVIEFSSKRKRMSIIVRFPDGRICIFCKGADSVLSKRLRLAPLAKQKVAEVQRRSSLRKSLEAEKALRRMSEGSPRNSLSRGGNMRRTSVSGLSPRGSNANNLVPMREELESWLRDRQQDVDLASVDNPDAYAIPRTSLQHERRLSMAESKRSIPWDDDYFDGLVDEVLAVDDVAVFDRTFQHIDDFATEGLRTLLYGYKFLDEKDYTKWKKVFHDASTSLVDRQTLIENAGEIIEQGFELAGATAIEDKLQKGVPETIDKLRRANIRMWMLTGDKRETAINIGHSCRLIKDYSNVIVLDHELGNVENLMATSLLEIESREHPHSVVVIDGQTLSYIDDNEALSNLFFDLAIVADSVVCCRASPSQKASLVKQIRLKVDRSVTLAIGDGANDIAMIQEAHVGIGITGREGLQAARISDYSIAQFRFLQKLLLVHGRWNYIRTGKYILGTFWKEMLFYLTQALYQRWNGYTGTSLYEPWSLSMFNTLFTSLPVIFLGIFEQDLSASTLLAVPELYTQGQRNDAFNFHKYFWWMFMASSEAMVIFFLMLGLYTMTAERDIGVFVIGDLAFSCCVIIINTKLLFIEMHYKTLISVAGWLLSVIGWALWNVALSAVYSAKNSTVYAVKAGFIKHFGGSPKWWLIVILITQAVIIFEIAILSIKNTWLPSDTSTWQALEKDAVVRKRLEEAATGEMTSTENHMAEAKVGRVSDDLEQEREFEDLMNVPKIVYALSPIPTAGSVEDRGFERRRSSAGNGSED